MTDRDTSRSSQPYELFMFARKHGLPLPKARMIINAHGSDRAGADAAAIACREDGRIADQNARQGLPATSDGRCG